MTLEDRDDDKAKTAKLERQKIKKTTARKINK